MDRFDDVTLVLEDGKLVGGECGFFGTFHFEEIRVGAKIKK